MFFAKPFLFDDPKVCCGNCEYFSIGDLGLSEASKLQLMSEQAANQQPIKQDMGACIKNPPVFLSRPGVINVDTGRGMQQAMGNIPAPSFPMIHKTRKCGNFEPANFIKNDDGSIKILDASELNNG